MKKHTQKYQIIKSDNIFKLDLAELWSFRELFYIFAWRDVKVRYKQTMLGVIWAILQPLTTMIIFTFFFGKLAKIPSGNLPYMLFVYIGLIIWTFFSTSLANASNSMVEQGLLIKKVYFPRLTIPFAAIVTSAIDFAITFIFLLLMLIYFRITPHSLTIILFPLLMLITLLTSSGAGMFLSALNVKYRDVRYVLPFFIQMLMFLSPIIYPTTIIASRHKWIFALNPLTSVVETSRELFSGGANINWLQVLTACISATVIFIAGLIYFKKTEKFFADIV